MSIRRQEPAEWTAPQASPACRPVQFSFVSNATGILNPYLNLATRFTTGNVVGRAAPAGTTVQLIDSNGSEKDAVYPCFEHMTMVDLLPSTFTWRYYAPSAGSIWTAPNAIHAGVNDGGGPSWVASIVNAIGNSTSCDGNTG